MLKRATDVLGALAGLVLTAPLMLAVWLAVRLDSPGDAIYAQTRVGRGGRPFRLYKFRTMVAGADRRGPLLTGKDDRRITRVGRVLRPTRLDELPQLWNVLRGDMSLVGPRPEVPSIVEHYSAEQRAVLAVRPGLTGPTQLAWLDEAERYPDGVDREEYYRRHILPVKLQSDLEYVRTRSGLGDLVHLLGLPFVIVGVVLRRFGQGLGYQGMSRKGVRLLSDCLAVVLANFLAFGVRFDWKIPYVDLMHLRDGLPVVCLVYLVTFLVFRTYRAVWEFAAIEDVWLLVRAAAFGAGLHILVNWLLGWYSYPRSVVVGTGLLALLLLGGIRLVARSSRRFGWSARDAAASRRVVIVGAGEAGAAIAREVRENPALGYEIVGFVDDRPARRGETIHGLPVLGTTADIADLARTRGLQEALIAIPRLANGRLRRLTQVCMDAGLTFRTLPSLTQLVRGEGKLRYLRKLNVEDLLRRAPRGIDEAEVRAFLGGKRVLVTGAGGSIGSELCRQAVRLGAESVIMIERAENALHEISVEMREGYPGAAVVPVLADVKHLPRMTEIFEQFRPDIVFHAAAYKHVPILESHPGEAVLNNVVGTRRLTQVARKFGVETFMLISTDKAVRAKNLMGATKKICEMYVAALNQASRGESRIAGPRTRFLLVRFGNVLGSSGSVLPRFEQQIEHGEPLTITDPEMSRFFMTVPEAVGLVLQSAAMRSDESAFVLDMGAPVKIGDLADDLVTSLGLSPMDVDRKYVGVRPGEKDHEMLWDVGEEQVRASGHERILAIRQPPRSLTEMEALVSGLEAAAVNGETARLLARIAEAVPTYAPDPSKVAFRVAEPGEKHRILIVDDDRLMCDVILESLDDGFETTAVHSARDAYERIQAEMPHLVLLDVNLPGESGFWLCRTLRADPKYWQMAIIFMTGFGEDGTAVSALETGGDDYLTKPFKLDELRARVDAVLRRKHPLLGWRFAGSDDVRPWQESPEEDAIGSGGKERRP